MAACFFLWSLWGCETQNPKVVYAVGTEPIYARIQSEFSAQRLDGGKAAYRSRIEAALRIRRLDTAHSPMALEMTLDSISYTSSERDSQELAFMRARLEHYHARWHMSPDGRVLDLTEEPELPHGDFSSRLGPLLVAFLPIFGPAKSPTSPVVADTQTLFDPTEPGAFLIQNRVGADRKTSDDEVEGERHFMLHLAGGATPGIQMNGGGGFQFDAKLGFPREMQLDLNGELPGDSMRTGQDFGMKIRFQYRFEITPTQPR